MKTRRHRHPADELVDAIDGLRDAREEVFQRTHWQNAHAFTDAERKEARADVRASRVRLLKAIRGAVGAK